MGVLQRQTQLQKNVVIQQKESDKPFRIQRVNQHKRQPHKKPSDILLDKKDGNF